MDRRQTILNRIDIAGGKGLEIGPLAAPLVAKHDGNIHYLDYYATAELKKKYIDDPNVNVGMIVDIDIPTAGLGIAEAAASLAPFDYVVASHVIEHVPDLIGWLAEIASTLRVGGRLALAVPDKRFTFDVLRETTRFRELLNPYFFAFKQPSPAQHYDFRTLATGPIPVGDAWARTLEYSAIRPTHDSATAMAMVRDAWRAGRYEDSHCTVFTDESFLSILQQMIEHDLLDFAVADFVGTAPGNFEFYATLEKLPPSEDRTTMRSVQRDSLPREFIAAKHDRTQDTVPSSEVNNATRALAEAAILRAEIKALRSSRSWRMTKPCRALGRAVRRALRGP